MTASTQRDDTEAKFGRLNNNRNNGAGWCAQSCCGSQDWLQVDLGQTTEICGVATHGNKRHNKCVIDFKLSYLSDGSGWTTYKDSDGSDGKVRYNCFFLFVFDKDFNSD